MKKIISWDLGGTKCAAGVIEYNLETQELHCKEHCSVKLKKTTSLEDLVLQLEQGLNLSMAEADAICIGAAGQYNGQVLNHENAYPYPMQFADLAKKQRWPAFDVVHDYVPIVCATFTSYMDNPNNIKRLNAAPMNNEGRRVAFGLGTGLGLKDGVLLPNGEFWLGRNEIGHIGITNPPAATATELKRHEELMRFMQRDSLPVTFEKILSGPGTVRMYEFFHPNHETTTPQEVGTQMREGKIEEMSNAFAWYLGLFVGTTQLIFLPEGGVWITGGVALSHLDLFDREDFYAGIKASPAYLLQREQYPLGVLSNPEHALIGAGYYAIKRLIETPKLACLTRSTDAVARKYHTG